MTTKDNSLKYCIEISIFLQSCNKIGFYSIYFWNFKLENIGNCVKGLTTRVLYICVRVYICVYVHFFSRQRGEIMMSGIACYRRLKTMHNDNFRGDSTGVSEFSIAIFESCFRKWSKHIAYNKVRFQLWRRSTGYCALRVLFENRELF